MTITTRNPAIIFGLLTMMPLATAAQSPTDVSFPTSDGGMIDADLYGSGTRGVVFAHGAVFNKQSWAPLAKRIAIHGFRALAIDFRGYGRSRAGKKPSDLYLDVIAAVHWLHQQGVTEVDVVGGSMGGGASGKAATMVKPGEIDKLVLLSPVPFEHPEHIKAKSTLFIASRLEALEPEVERHYQRAPGPKKLVLLNGNAHAQNIFATDEAQKLSDDIVTFLTRDE